MSEPTAGALLRTAREAHGLSLGALAAMLKVGQRKLEALEADRLDELPDATFARALAQTVCKALKIDPAPVLAALPRTHVHRLEHLGEGINAPFRDRAGRAMARTASGSNPAWWWSAAAIVVAALLVVLVPTSWWTVVRSGHGATGAEPADARASDAAVTTATVAMNGMDAASLPSTGADGAAALSPPVADPPGGAAPPAPAPPRAAASAGMAGSSAAVPPGVAASDAALQLHARAASWVQVQDASGRTLLSRTLAVDEQVAIDGAPPLRLTVGNARATDVRFRGSPVDLTPTTRDNVARLEIKP